MDDKLLKVNYEKPLRFAAIKLGRKGGSVKSDTKAKAARENGKRGGRPVKCEVCECTLKTERMLERGDLYDYIQNFKIGEIDFIGDITLGAAHQLWDIFAKEDISVKIERDIDARQDDEIPCDSDDHCCIRRS